MKVIDRIKNHFVETLKNVRWEVRYKNLLKKYDEISKENERLKKDLDDDYKTKLIKDKDKYINMLKRQRNNLRNDLENLKK